MKAALAVLAGSLIIAASVLIVGRWQIAGTVSAMLKLDRWSGAVDYCIANEAEPFDPSGKTLATKCYRIKTAS